MNDNLPPHPTSTPITVRLQQLMAALQQDITHFSKQLGCPVQLLRDYLTHATGANLDFLAMVISQVDGLRADWLLAGRGAMFDEPNPAYNSNSLDGNSGNTVGVNHGIVLNITHAECTAQLRLATLLIAQQQQQIEDKNRIIKLLESQNHQ